MRALAAAVAGIALGFGGLAIAQSQVAAPAKPAASGSLPQGNFFAVKGYLAPGAVPDSLQINPPPPAPGSAAEARDIEASKAALKLQGTPRFVLAKRDADIFLPDVISIYSCAAGVELGPKTTPKTNQLLQRALRDLAGATSPTKRKYMRARPFTVNNQPTCTPDAEQVLRMDGSYPSGHAALGFGWSLILSEAMPASASRLVARGRAFADSRRVCNVHWLSDTEEGMLVASAVVARLNVEPEFRADLEAARAELAAAPRKDTQSAACASEGAALAMR
jgi:acid phosphatase (class A)